MFTATTWFCLAAWSIAASATVVRDKPPDIDPAGAAVMLMMAGAAFVGAGVGALFDRTLLGIVTVVWTLVIVIPPLAIAAGILSTFIH